MDDDAPFRTLALTGAVHPVHLGHRRVDHLAEEGVHRLERLRPTGLGDPQSDLAHPRGEPLDLAFPVVLDVDDDPSRETGPLADGHAGELLDGLGRLAMPADQQAHVLVVGFGADDVHVHRAVLERRLHGRGDAHPFEHALEELGRDLGLFVEVVLAQVAVGLDPRADDHDRLLGADPEHAGPRLLHDLDVGLLFAETELAQGGLDGLLNAWGASSDLLHGRCLRTLVPSGWTPARWDRIRSSHRSPPSARVVWGSRASCCPASGSCRLGAGAAARRAPSSRTGTPSSRPSGAWTWRSRPAARPSAGS